MNYEKILKIIFIVFCPCIEVNSKYLSLMIDESLEYFNKLLAKFCSELKMRHIEFSVRLDSLEEDAKSLYRLLRPEIGLIDIELKEFDDGIVNSIVCLTDAKSNDPVVIRTYSIKIKKFQENQTKIDRSNSFKFINRDLELKALERASEVGITIKLMATYSNGFIYKYIDGQVNSVDRYDAETARKVARKLARLHSITLDGLARERPLVDMYSKFDEDPCKAEKVKFNEKMNNGDYPEFTCHLPSYMTLQSIYEKLNDLILKNDGYGKRCLCHNDLTLTNILIEKTSKNPFLIDFEMVNTNYQNYDIALHMLLLGGIFAKYFYADQVPDAKFIISFLRSYHEEANKLDCVKIEEEEFDRQMDIELRKILAIMLSIRIQMIQRCLFHYYFFPDKLQIESVKQFCFALYDDYLTRKDDHLRLFGSVAD